jgi:dihydrofolate synthase / folylpolyglutamate synthase
MTYTEAVAYLESLIDYERSPAGAAAARLWNLDRMRDLLRAVGDPHLAPRTLHIAGTKGKGSTAAMTASILTAAGLCTGLYTSPHLVSFQERIRVDGQPISEADVVALTERVRPLIEEAKGSEFGPPSFFEAYTLMAFLHFAQVKVECAVIETGLGGRLDATNVITPLGCAITRLGYDHMQELGDSLAEIAREKAGIIKPGLSAISAPQATEALEVLQDVCLERHAQLLVVGDDGPRVRITAFDQQRMEMVIDGRLGRYAGLQTPLVGAHQAENAAVAVGLVELLEPHGLRISPAAIAEGLASVRWPGRFQIVRRRPTVVLDGAHDEAAAEVLAATLSTLYPGRRILLVLGVHRDKDAEAIAAHLCPLADRVIATASSSPRAVEARELQRTIFRRCRHTSAYTPVSLAVQEALDHARTDDIVVITGSLYVVGEAMRALGVQVAE